MNLVEKPMTVTRTGKSVMESKTLDVSARKVFARFHVSRISLLNVII